MSVPYILESMAVFIDGGEEEAMEEPEMCSVTTVQVVQCLKTQKKGAPSTSELRSHFYPQSLDSCIAGRAEKEKIERIYNSSKMKTYDPHMNDPR